MSSASNGPLAVPPSPSSSKRSRSRDSSQSAATSSTTTPFATPSATPSASAPSLIIPPSSSTSIAEHQYNLRQRPQEQAPDPTPYPAFLRLSKSDIADKFQELEWQQRERLMPNGQPPPLGTQWAKCGGAEVMSRNRYANVDPWANNRVKLVVPDGACDYINASPIVLQSTKSGKVSRFIATQGPKAESYSHIWRMIWNETTSSDLTSTSDGDDTDPAVTIMLTKTHEANREKCFPYYPRSTSQPTLRINPHDEFGDGICHDLNLISLTEQEDISSQVRELELVARAPPPPAAVSSSLSNSPKSEDGSGSRAGSKPGSRSASRTRPKLPGRTRSSSSTTSSPNSPAPPPPPPPNNTQSNPNPNPSITIGTKKKVLHYLFTSWPDFSVPDSPHTVSALVNLIYKTRASNSNPENPRIVHCSAGVGRSGTFIALDWLLTELDDGVFDDIDDAGVQQQNAGGGEEEQEEEEEFDPVYGVVHELRGMRMMMVQSESQYAFLYDVLRERWRERWIRRHPEEARVLGLKSNDTDRVTDAVDGNGNGTGNGRKVKRVRSERNDGEEGSEEDEEEEYGDDGGLGESMMRNGGVVGRGELEMELSGNSLGFEAR